MPRENLHQRAKVTHKRRRRRSTEEIIDRIREAACDEFERNGYAGTKTAEIARKAGVAEPLIFNNFGSKAGLFRDSVFEPLNRHFVQFCATHLVEAGDSDGLREHSQQYIQELRQFIEHHSRTLSSLVATQMYASKDVQGLSQIEGLHEFFSRAAARHMSRLTGKPKIPPKLVARVSFACILACVIFRDWLFPEGLASADEINAAISDFVLDGVNANADAKLSAPRSVGSRGGDD